MKVPAPAADTYAIAMSDFIDHSLMNKFKNAGYDYRSVHGGVTSIKKALNDLNARISNTMAKKAIA